ncbi:thioredoxin family protein [Planctomicrobium sp. SH661]|uniref:thioredoxin family protein n=1 Tax=Planctomicrobium sp. SH661 TaxID=3448124 RepID=UPI003F5C2ABE
MKYLNALGALLLAMVLPFALQDRTAPPDDPWFQSSVARHPRPVLVKFGADWCPPCRHMEGVLDRAEGRLAGKVKIVRIDVDEKPEIAQHYGVSGIPRVMLFQDGKVVASHGGFGDVDQLQEWVNRYTR